MARIRNSPIIYDIRTLLNYNRWVFPISTLWHIAFTCFTSSSSALFLCFLCQLATALAHFLTRSMTLPRTPPTPIYIPIYINMYIDSLTVLRLVFGSPLHLVHLLSQFSWPLPPRLFSLSQGKYSRKSNKFTIIDSRFVYVCFSLFCGLFLFV